MLFSETYHKTFFFFYHCTVYAIKTLQTGRQLTGTIWVLGTFIVWFRAHIFPYGKVSPRLTSGNHKPLFVSQRFNLHRMVIYLIPSSIWLLWHQYRTYSRHSVISDLVSLCVLYKTAQFPHRETKLLHSFPIFQSLYSFSCIFIRIQGSNRV